MFFGIAQASFAQQPEYAKWGKIAVQETMKKYPNSKLVDYEYDGKVIISDERAQYNFKFTLKQNNREKEVLAYVLINPKTNKYIETHFDEIQDFG